MFLFCYAGTALILARMPADQITEGFRRLCQLQIVHLLEVRTLFNVS